MKRETEKPLDEQRRMIAYLDGLQAKVHALRELQSHRDASQVAPVRWADAEAEYS